MGAYRVAQETDEQLQYIKKAIEVIPGVDLNWRSKPANWSFDCGISWNDSTAIRPDHAAMNRPLPGILDRVQTVVHGHWSTTQAPTSSHRRSYEIAADEFSELLGDLRKLVEKDVVALRRKLDAANAPGRRDAVFRNGSAEQNHGEGGVH